MDTWKKYWFLSATRDTLLIFEGWSHLIPFFNRDINQYFQGQPKTYHFFQIVVIPFPFNLPLALVNKVILQHFDSFVSTFSFWNNFENKKDTFIIIIHPLIIVRILPCWSSRLRYSTLILLQLASTSNYFSL